MKNTITLFLIISLSSSFAMSQFVETYPNSQRYYFNELTYGEYSFFAGSANPIDTTARNNIIYTRYIIDTQLTIYGVAIPISAPWYLQVDIFCDSITTLPTIDPHLLYDSIPNMVYFALEPLNNSLPITIYDSTFILQNNHYIIGNFVQFPETPIFNICPTFQTIEVYFSQPIAIARAFGLGASLTNFRYRSGIGVLVNPLEGTANSNFATVSGNIILMNGLRFWGGPMPIIAPPPCVPPFEINHVGQQGRSVSFEWRAQYINSWCEAEYGPKDFAEGTGTVVGPLTPNADYKCSLTIDSLENLTEYTLRVRSWCAQTNSFSDWRSLDFTTEEWYTVTARSNNESWGVVYGGDIYPAGTVVQLTAWPRGPEYLFTNWTDGSQQNPRTVTVTQDTLFKAIFIDQTAEGIDLAEGGATLTLSPNPAHSATTITAPFRIHGWQITDSYGRTVAEQSGLNDYTASADLRRLSPGLYIIRVNSGNGILTKKLIRL